MKDWMKQLFTTIDRKDAEGFALFLTETASFRFGNAPAVIGKEKVRGAVYDFFSKVKGLRHHIVGVWEIGDTVICEGEVTYTIGDNKTFALPFVNIFRMKDDLIADYRIYMDISPLFV